MAKKIITHKKCKIQNCNGEYKPNGIAYMTSLPRYVHICTNCGDKTDFNKLYPNEEIIFEKNEITEVYE